MPDPTVTDQERAAFQPEITRNRALDYFFAFDNVPLQFFYRDKLILGVLNDLEKRNKAITETLWLEAYHQYLVANIGYAFLYRGPVLQMVFQVHQFGAGTFAPPAAESRTFLATVENVQASFDTWMANTGWKMADELHKQPARGSWASLLGVPDRSVRIASLMAVGNQVVLELISTWTEDGVLKETAWVAILIYDTDGTVLQDRSYIDLVNWPSARRYAQQRLGTPPTQQNPIGIGIMDRFYEYHKSRRIGSNPTDLEKRNLEIIEQEWVDSFNTGLDTNVFHKKRFRMHLPIQKCSYNLDLFKETEQIVKEATPYPKMRLGMTYTKGNQVAVEGLVTWSKDGVAQESPFISFLLIDEEGKVIRDRRYITLSNWPGADRMGARLGL